MDQALKRGSVTGRLPWIWFSGIGEMQIVEDLGTQTGQDFIAEFVFPNGTVTVDLQGIVAVNTARMAGTATG